MDQLVRGVHTLGGWGLLHEKRNLLSRRVTGLTAGLADLGADLTPVNATRLAGAIAAGKAKARRELGDARPALDDWDAAMARFTPVVAEQLQQAEQVGRLIALRRLDDSLVQVITQTRRYLTGFDDSIFARTELTFPRTVRLKPAVTASGTKTVVDPVSDLRAKALQLARVQSDTKTKDALAALAALATSTAGAGVLLVTTVAGVHQSAVRGVQLAAFRNGLAAEHPVLHRLDLGRLGEAGRTVPPSDAELLAGLKEVLATTWRAAHAVRSKVVADAWSADHARHPEGPAAGLGLALRGRGMSGGLAGLLNGSFGPWGFKKVMADAAGDLAGPGQSVVGQAVHDVYQAADPDFGAEFADMLGLTGGMLVLHLAAPPLALVADVVLAVKGIVEAVVEFLRGQDAYECVLDPARSFGTEPSMLRLALQCAGEVAGGLPGAGKLATSVSLIAPLAAGFAS